MAGGGCGWLVVNILWLVEGSGVFVLAVEGGVGWWWIVGGVFWLVVGGGGWW